MSDLKVGDEVWYLLPGGLPRLWTITRLWDTHTEGIMACLSRPDDTKKLGVERCNAGVEGLERDQG